MISIDLGPISAGSSATVALVASPQAAALGLLTMTASAQGYNADVEPAQAQASATVTVAPAADLSVTLAPQSAPAYQDVNATYTITVSNAGPSGATNVSRHLSASPRRRFRLGDRQPGISACAPGWPGLRASGIIGRGAERRRSPSSSTPPQPAPSGLPLSASVTADQFDPNPGNNTASATMPVLPSDDLAVTLVPAAGTGEVGKNLSLTATVLNSGPSPAAGVVLQFPLPRAPSSSPPPRRLADERPGWSPAGPDRDPGGWSQQHLHHHDPAGNRGADELDRQRDG